VAAFEKLGALRQLYLSEEEVGDDSLKHLAGCKRLRVLMLCGQQSGDEGLRHLEFCKPLRELSLIDTQATKAGATRLARADAVHCEHSGPEGADTESGD
jgi:hypothetical protein